MGFYDLSFGEWGGGSGIGFSYPEIDGFLWEAQGLFFFLTPFSLHQAYGLG